MLLKKKTIFAYTVKLLLGVTTIHAQTIHQSNKHDTTHLPAITLNKYYPPPVYKNPVSGNFYSKRLPFFCNKELQVQKAVGIPIKFRLGSVEYCDKLEGKNK